MSITYTSNKKALAKLDQVKLKQFIQALRTTTKSTNQRHNDRRW